MSVLAGFIAVYSTTWSGTFVAIFPGILLSLAIGYMYLMFGLKVDEDVSIDRKEGISIALYTLYALIIIGFTGKVLTRYPLAVQSLSTTQQQLYGAMIAVAEEQFFRGFLTEYAWRSTGSMTAAVSSSTAIFTVFHLAVYGTSASSLIYVAIAGATLSWIALRSQRISPTIFAHVANNLRAVTAGV